MTAMQQAIRRRRRTRRRSSDSVIEILATPYKHRPTDRPAEASQAIGRTRVDGGPKTCGNHLSIHRNADENGTEWRSGRAADAEIHLTL